MSSRYGCNGKIIFRGRPPRTFFRFCIDCGKKFQPTGKFSRKCADCKPRANGGRR